MHSPPLSCYATLCAPVQLFSVFAGVLFIVTFIMLVFYLPAATKLKKLRHETTGSLVGLVAETLEGLSVINAYGEWGFLCVHQRPNTPALQRCCGVPESAAAPSTQAHSLACLS